MTKARLFPHLRASDAAFEWGEWVVARADGTQQPVEDRLTAWDYHSSVSFGVVVRVVEGEFLASTSLASLDECDVVVLVDCPSTGQRFHRRMSLSEIGDGQSTIMVATPAGVLADRVRLTAHVVLSKALSASGNRAVRESSRLAESPSRLVVLEGDLHRFPTETVSFSALRLEGAAWAVRLDYTSLADSFVGSVRLLLNSDHPAAKSLLEMSDERGGVLHSVLRIDVARQLIATVAADEFLSLDDFDPSTAEEGSLRAGLEALTATFLSMDLRSAIDMARKDPPRFERNLQVGFEFLMEMAR